MGYIPVHCSCCPDSILQRNSKYRLLDKWTRSLYGSIETRVHLEIQPRSILPNLSKEIKFKSCIICEEVNLSVKQLEMNDIDLF